MVARIDIWLVTIVPDVSAVSERIRSAGGVQ